MFRLTQKGKQSYNNHRIINQTTKISSDHTKLSTPARNSLHQSEQPHAEQPLSSSDENPPLPPTPPSLPFVPESHNFELPACMAYSLTVNTQIVPLLSARSVLDDVSVYLSRMKGYQVHLKRLESVNADLEMENSNVKLENDLLKSQLEIAEKYYAADTDHADITVTNFNKTIHSTDTASPSLAPNISPKIQNDFYATLASSIAHRPH